LSFALESARWEHPLATWSARRETLHKILWVAFMMIDQGVVLAGSAVPFWTEARIGFLPVLALAAVSGALAFRYRCSLPVSKRFPLPWVWLDVQVSAFCEEVLFRGLLPFGLFLFLTPASGPLQWSLLIGGAALLFGVPHYRFGSPAGVRGVALMTLLGTVCLLGSIATGTVLFGYALHGLALGTIGWERWRRQQRHVRQTVALPACLQVIRLRKAFYVTDWEGLRVEPLCSPTSPLASTIQRMAQANAGGVVLGRPDDVSQLCDFTSAHEVSNGMRWWKQTNAFLAVQLPYGVLPDVGFSSRALATCSLLRGLLHPTPKKERVRARAKRHRLQPERTT